MTDEEKNTEITEKLKNLPRIKTGDDFILKLESRIAEFESEKIIDTEEREVYKEKKSFWKLFGHNRNPWLVPAMGLAIIALFTFSIIKFNETQIKDDLILEKPKTNSQIDLNSIESNKENSELKDADKIPDGNVTSKAELENLKEKVSATDQNPETAKNLPLPVETKIDRSGKDEVNSNPPVTKFSTESEVSKKENSSDINNSDSRVENESAIGEETGIMKSEVITSEPNAGQEMKRSSENDTEEFEGAIEKSIIEKLNKVNKQKLDSLKKKINKP